MSDIVLPKQLNNELLENALKNVCADKTVKVLNFHTKPAAGSGDNYTSDVYRVLVDYQLENSESKQISLIVKYMLEIEGVDKLLDDYKMFVKEKEIYSNILPKFSKMLNEDFAPKCHFLMDNPSQIFVMEDLKESGFVVVDRQAGLDLKHSKLLVTKLAKWHAASMIMAEKDPEKMNLFDFGLINKNSSFGSAIPSMFIASLGSLIEEATHFLDFQEIIEKLKKIKENFGERAIKCIDQHSSFKVLNHGDLWTNNFMIKYDEMKNPVDVLFIDHQLGFYSSMGIDLNYFMTLSANNAVKLQHRELVLETYHSALIDSLAKLNYSRSKFPTLRNVQDEVTNFEFYGLIASVGILPLVLMDRDSGVVSGIESLQNKNTGEEVRKVQMRGKIFQETIKIVLRRLNTVGALD